MSIARGGCATLQKQLVELQTRCVTIEQTTGPERCCNKKSPDPLEAIVLVSNSSYRIIAVLTVDQVSKLKTERAKILEQLDAIKSKIRGLQLENHLAVMDWNKIGLDVNFFRYKLDKSNQQFLRLKQDWNIILQLTE